MLLNREMLLAKESLKVEKVELSDGNFVFVRQMTGRERDRFEQSMLKPVRSEKGDLDYERTLEDFRAKLAVNVLCDEDGKNLLEPFDYEVLSQNMSAATLEKIVNVAQSLNRITNEDREGLVKN